MICSAALALALGIAGRGWPAEGSGAETCGHSYDARWRVRYDFSEWLNVQVRQTWAYTDLMPRLPPLDIWADACPAMAYVAGAGA